MSDGMISKNENGIGGAAWPASLALTSLLGSLALACVFPFAAVAALAALTMQPARGFALVVAVWAVNQLTGFFLLSFPWDAQAVGHGLAILAGTLFAFGTARFVAGAVARGGDILRSLAALVSAFAVYQLVLRAYASVGGGAENFSAEIISAVALNDALWFAGLFALRFIVAQARREDSIFATA